MIMDLIDLAAKIGPTVAQVGLTTFLTVALVYVNKLRLEEKQRADHLQKERDQLLERVLKAIGDATTAMENGRDVMNVIAGLIGGLRDWIMMLALNRTGGQLPPMPPFTPPGEAEPEPKKGGG